MDNQNHTNPSADGQKPHKRRVRYKGTHPRNYKEKYKELNPEKERKEAVKKSFKQYQKAGLYSEIADEVIRPSAEECIRNSRAKSTKMRWAVRSLD